MDTEDITSKVKNFFKKSAAATKSVFEKTGNKVQDFSDKNVLRMEKHKLEKDVYLVYQEMGEKLYKILKEGGKLDLTGAANLPPDCSEADFDKLVSSVTKLKKEIQKKEKELKEKKSK